jgi:hypothetical protein
MSSSVKLVHVAKLLNKAGHPGTHDTEALTFVRKAYALVDAAGTDFAAMLKAPAPRPSQREIELHDTISQLRRELGAERNHHWRAADNVEVLGRKITELNSKLRKVQREKNNLRDEVKELRCFESIVPELLEENDELKAELLEATTTNQKQAEEIAALHAEVAAFKARTPAPVSAESVQSSLRQQEHESITRTKEFFEKANVAQPTHSEILRDLNIQGLIAALNVLRKIDPDMRIKTALAYLHTAASEGLIVSDVTSRVGQASVGSIRYAMRTLGQGWPDKRIGMGLIEKNAKADGGRAWLYVASERGRQILRDITRAIQTVSMRRPQEPNLRMAA